MVENLELKVKGELFIVSMEVLGDLINLEFNPGIEDEVQRVDTAIATFGILNATVQTIIEKTYDKMVALGLIEGKQP